MEKAVQCQNTFYCEILIQNLHSKAVLILGSQGYQLNAYYIKCISTREGVDPLDTLRPHQNKLPSWLSILKP